MRTIVHLFFIFSPFVTLAQGLVNNGSKIVLGTGSYLTIEGSNADFVNDFLVTNGSVDNDGTITLQGNWTNNASNNVFINANSSGEVILNGSTPQSIAGTTVTKFEQLTINSSGGVTLNQSEIVRNSLALTVGALTLSSNAITINNNSLAAITRTNGYIVSEQTDNAGKLLWNIGNNTGSYVLPFGAISGGYIPLTIDLTAGNIGTVTVSTYPTAIDNTPYPVTPVLVTNVMSSGLDNSANTVDRFWQIDKDGVSGTVTLTFTAQAGEVGSIIAPTAQLWNSINNSWDYPLPGQTSTATSATVPGVTSFGAWTLASSSALLPIGLLSFTATLENFFVDLNWTTASEINNDYFTVEKSPDGVTFETIVIIDAAANSTQALNYSARDDKPYSKISYYRLKQTDLDGTVFYSKTVYVEITTSNIFNVNVFPNPANDDINISIAGTYGKEELVRLTDILGKECYSKLVTMKSNNYTLTITGQSLAPGAYLVTVSDNKNYCSKKVVIN